MTNSKGKSYPLDMVCLRNTHNTSCVKIPYDLVVGRLMYAMLCPRPDICYAVGVVSMYKSNNGLEH